MPTHNFLPAKDGIIYNVTTKVLQTIASDWLDWINHEHIPDMLATGCFDGALVLQLTGQEDEEGPTYAVQYHAPSKADYERYIEQHSEGMRKKGLEKFGEKFISFRSVLSVVN